MSMQRPASAPTQATAHAALPEPTREQLTLAYRNIWLFGMPDSLDEALQRPALKACIHGAAVRLRRAPMCTTPPPRLGSIHWAPPTPTQPPGRQKTPGSSKPMPFDYRKAAANDRDDA